MTELQDVDDGNGTDAVHRAFDEHLVDRQDVDPKRFRWIIKTLLYKHDPYACLSLARNPALMNVDPRLTGRYLGEVGLCGKSVKDKRVVDAMVGRISSTAEDQFDALDLHLLKATGRRRLGNAEAKEFRSIATDFSRRWPIRVYAWAAYIESTKRYPELMEAASLETIPQLRRGMIAKLRGHITRAFLSHARMNFPESRFVVHWLQAA